MFFNPYLLFFLSKRVFDTGVHALNFKQISAWVRIPDPLTDFSLFFFLFLSGSFVEHTHGQVHQSLLHQRARIWCPKFFISRKFLPSHVCIYYRFVCMLLMVIRTDGLTDYKGSRNLLAVAQNEILRVADVFPRVIFVVFLLEPLHGKITPYIARPFAESLLAHRSRIVGLASQVNHLTLPLAFCKPCGWFFISQICTLFDLDFFQCLILLQPPFVQIDYLTLTPVLRL